MADDTASPPEVPNPATDAPPESEPEAAPAPVANSLQKAFLDQRMLWLREKVNQSVLFTENTAPGAKSFTEEEKVQLFQECMDRDGLKNYNALLKYLDDEITHTSVLFYLLTNKQQIAKEPSNDKASMAMS